MPKMYNIDRWLTYSRQRAIQQGNFKANLYGSLVEMTPKQMRRLRKKALKNRDFSVTSLNHLPVLVGTEFDVDADTADHDIECTCIMCIPGAM